MPWSDFPIQTLVIPGDAGPGDPRIVLDGDTGKIEVYNAANELIALISPDPADVGIWVLDADGSYVRIFDENPGNGALIHLNPPNGTGVVTPAEIRGEADPLNDPVLSITGANPDGAGAPFIKLRSAASPGTGNSIRSESDQITLTANDGDLSAVAEDGDVLVVAGNIGTGDIILRAGAPNLADVRFNHNGAVDFTPAINVTNSIGGIGIGVTRAAVKGGDTTRTNTTAVTADPNLQLPVEANAVYLVEESIPWMADAAPDIVFGHTAPAGATLSRWRAVTNGTAAVWTDVGANLAATMFQAGNGTDETFLVSAVLRTGANAGTFATAWGPNASSANACTVRGDASLKLTRVA